MANLFLIAAVIFGFVIGWAVNDLHQRWGNLQARIKQLEEAQAKHLPYITADEIENAEAALLYVKQANDLRGDMIDNALAHLGKARKGNNKKIKLGRE